MKHHVMYVIALVVGVAVLVACARPNINAQVQIEYEQLANFYEYKLSPDAFSSTGAGNGMFILYKIKKITNTGSEAMAYVFDKHKVLTVTPDQTSNDEPSGDNILLGAKLVTNLTVQPGQTKTNSGCIIKNAHTSNPQSLANTSALVDLIHQIDPSQPVSMARVPGDNTTALVGNALPSTLQNLCGTTE
ncbi:MAG: hypothetical protein L0Y68_09115 [Candidatus Dadabacteria bacterium]|nr:hypothetical protein [Candidatus Dadabacteria bacterium]